MGKYLVACGAMGVIVSTAVAVPGQSWILPIHHRSGGGWVEYPGAGYGGSSAWQGSGKDGTRRVYWELSGAGVPSTTELYSIQYYVPVQGSGGWQPIESQFNGVNGETWPIDDDIPWVGAWGENHQYIKSEFVSADQGKWKAAGPGPHAPEDDTYGAGPNGTSMWLMNGSWLYAKWDFTFSVTHSWSALKLTQVTPEPTSLALLAAGALVLLRRR